MRFQTAYFTDEANTNIARVDNTRPSPNVKDMGKRCHRTTWAAEKVIPTRKVVRRPNPNGACGVGTVARTEREARAAAHNIKPATLLLFTNGQLRTM